MFLLDVIKFIFPLILLSYGSLSDLKTREVTNRLWVLGFPVSSMLTITGLLVGEGVGLLPIALGSIAITTILSFSLFYLGLFGGADAKAMIFIALSLPLHPLMVEDSTFSYTTIILFPLSVFNNAIILSLSIVVFIIVKNLASTVMARPVLKGLDVRSPIGRMVLFATSYRTTLSSLRGKVYLYPAEVPVEANGIILRKARYFTSAEQEKPELMSDIERHADAGLYSDGILATPTIPMILFITIGYVVSLYIDFAFILAINVVRWL